MRWSWWTLGAGCAVGVTGAVVLAAGGGSGAAGFAMVAIGCALGAAAAGVVTAVLAVVDELRGRPVGPRRGWLALVLFVVALLLVGLAGGAIA